MSKFNCFEDFHFVPILESEKTLYCRQIMKYCEKICWKLNSNATTLDDLLADAQNGKDGGFASLSQFFGSTCFNDWVLLARITTLLHNRDHSDVVACVIRMAI